MAENHSSVHVSPAGKYHRDGIAAAASMRERFPIGALVEHTRHKHRGVGEVLGYSRTKVCVRFDSMSWGYYAHHLRRVSVRRRWESPRFHVASGDIADIGDVLAEAIERVKSMRPDLDVARRTSAVVDRVVEQKLHPWTQWTGKKTAR